MADNQRCLLVFTKSPRPGQVKTRLAPALGMQAAADVHAAMTHRTLSLAKSLRDITTRVWIAEDSEHVFADKIRQRYAFTCFDQNGTDLGERMYQALAMSGRQFSYTVLIGCDCPQLNSEIIHAAFVCLESGQDAVLGPASDGGYYLIGMREISGTVFTGLQWGGSSVAEMTREKFRSLGISWQELPVLSDVDRPEDLSLLQSAQAIPSVPETPNQ